DGISVKTLESVQEVYEEGTAMHHCVYTMKYYEKKDSLLLSAIDADGNHLETVELSLRTFKVLQSRGRFNKTTPFHDRIVSLVESNAPLFRARAQNKPA
ncbi:MAG: PcfJ domain-containing protein, partial [Muribaculaceae bacterium]|nr:PcfJ domain-containing protein [Muribaculaceae bacterium]